MFAIGFIMFMVFIVMAILNSSVKQVSGGRAPTWYAVTGTLMFLGGLFLMNMAIFLLMWRALP